MGHSCLQAGATAVAKQADLPMLSMRRRWQLAEAVAAARSARSRRSSMRSRMLIPTLTVHSATTVERASSWSQACWEMSAARKSDTALRSSDRISGYSSYQYRYAEAVHPTATSADMSTDVARCQTMFRTQTHQQSTHHTTTSHIYIDWQTLMIQS